MTAWWQRAVIYQLLVPSFQDSNDDGMGDFEGVIRHLDYLAWLGAGAIWLSPMYASPMCELGYDVSDYTDTNRRFGTLEDFDRLLAEAHTRGLKVLLDWVPNHTSNEHPWFAESRSARDSGKRDWYIWRDPRPDGSPPTNWISVFGGSVWEWDEHTGQYYCHTFLPSQPDLNWRNPAVAEAMHDAMRFWLARGVDGFRLDATSLILEDDQLRDNPPNPDYDPAIHAPDESLLPEHTRNQPGLHDITAGFRRVVDEFPDRVLLAELYLPIEQVVEFYGTPDRPEVQLPLNMQLAWQPWNAEQIGGSIEGSLAALPDGAWPAWVIATHDCLRVAARTTGDQPRIAAMLMCTLRGTPILYYGEEIGMRGVPIDAAHARDPQGRRIGRNRDPERTPMQWNATQHAGFTAGAPWLPIGCDVATANTAVQGDDPHSLLTLYRRLLHLRQNDPALVAGALDLISHQDPLVSYWRRTSERRLLVVLNFGSEPQEYRLPDDAAQGRVLLNTFLDREGESLTGAVSLRGDEGVLVEC